MLYSYKILQFRLESRYGILLFQLRVIRYVIRDKNFFNGIKKVICCWLSNQFIDC